MLNNIHRKTNSNYLYFFILCIIHTISVSIYFLVDIEAYQKDITLLISITIILLNIKYIKQVYDPTDKFIYLFPIYSIFSGLFMASLNFSQPFIYTALSSRILLIIAIMYIALIFLLNRISEETLYKFAFVVTIFIFTLDFYLYFSNNLSLLYIDTTHAFRMDSLRLTIAYQTVIVLLLFFFYHSKEKNLSYIPFMLLLIILIFIDKTRASILAVLMILLISSINFKSKKNLILLYLFIFVTILSIIFTNFESSIFQPLIDMYTSTQNEVQKGKGNIDVRALEFIYFWNKLDITSIIFGYGMDNQSFKHIYPSNFYLSDLGIFKVFYLHGIIGLLLFIGIYYKMFKEASKGNTSVHKTGKALVLFQIFAPTLNFTYYLEGMMLFFIIYILIKKYNRSNLNG